MDKNAIKKYAIWARNELIAKVSQKAAAYGIYKDNIVDANADSIDGVMLSSVEKKQRKALIEQINEKGYEQVIEEVAYTWFNRFTAIRFMEVNGYLPSHIRVFTDDDNSFKPQILTEAIHLNDIFEKINMNKVLELKQEDKTEELYKYLLIVQCNALNAVLPRMFQKIEDYSELLLPDYLLRDGSVLEQMISLIPEDDWRDQVQIIGWLYQYYIADPKDKLINAHKQYKSGDIPFVTQIFTSDWIVRFMVENSLGKLWLEKHPNEKLKSEWIYYIEESPNNTDNSINEENNNNFLHLKPEEIRVIDPCMGSGHILCVLFDTLIRIYEEYGYNSKDAVPLIIKNNIWGLDIDERAAQLAYFSIMMKARQYDRRIFTRCISPNIYVIKDSNFLKTQDISFLEKRINKENKDSVILQYNRLIDETYDASEFGSLIDVSTYDWDMLKNALNYDYLGQIEIDLNNEERITNDLRGLINIGQALSQKYHVVVTNPPYMNSTYMPKSLKSFIQDNYFDFKNDLFAAFTKKTIEMTFSNGYVGLLMPYVWMFITSYEKMREYVNCNTNISALVQLEYNAFEAACVPVAALTMKKTNIHVNGDYIKLSNFKGVDNQAPKTIEAVRDSNCEYRFSATQDDFSKIPGNPIAYWVSDKFFRTFRNPLLGEVAYPKTGLTTGDNDKYLRLWFEVDHTNIGKRWFYMNKGGSYRKWYGNNEYVVDWEDNGYRLKTADGSTIRNSDFYFREGVTWSKITSYKFAGRYSPSTHMFDAVGLTCFADDNIDIFYILAFFCSNLATDIMQVLNPTLSYTTGSIANLPFCYKSNRVKEISDCAKINVEISKNEWDSFETSWDFSVNPLIPYKSYKDSSSYLIRDLYFEWEKTCSQRFECVKKNEEKLNMIINEIYEIGDEVSASVDDNDITLRKADIRRDIKGLISYAVGCMFGRYSIDCPGLVYAGGKWDNSKYITFIPDKDAIIPICDDEYFEDDIVGRFVTFIEVVYGKDTLEENLRFITDNLKGKGSSREILRNYFINEFYSDHIKLYQKRPIYWLFDSGKKNGFKCLVYMHRYQPDTIARIRTDYVHEQQSRYRTSILDLENRIDKATTSERVNLNKILIKLKNQDEELRIYEEKIHHLADQMIEIDLDDGVKINYSKFQDVLAKIK